MNTETNKPLYKVLNEEKTQGIWAIDKYNSNLLVNSDDLVNRDCLCSFHHAKQMQYLSPTERANIEYTALAVNNLHHLAEALAPFIKFADAVLADTLKTSESPLYGYNDAVLYVKDLVAAKEAISKIS
jgi:hypothetical protein